MRAVLGRNPTNQKPSSVLTKSEMITSLSIKWLAVPSLLFLLLLIVPNVKAQSIDRFDPPGKILQEHQQQIHSLSSDKQALTFNQRFMPHQKTLRHTRQRKKHSQASKTFGAIPQETKTTITRFWAALTTIRYAQEYREKLRSSLPQQSLRKIVSLNTQRQWLLSKPSLGKLKYLLEFHDKLLTRAQQESHEASTQVDVSQFEKLYRQIDVTANQQTWIDLFNTLGFKGILTRLEEYWQAQDQQDPLLASSESLRQTAIRHYIDSRLIPMFHAHLLTQVIQVETQAYHTAWGSWGLIQEWQEQKITYLAKRRLCGRWKWMVHNHQNHGDHKTTMTFSPPEQSTPPQMQPTTILIHGDTVFLKWTFPQGFQEDSLLMSNHDTRLEGTFTNSLGPHGSISGQRLSPCQDYSPSK